MPAELHVAVLGPVAVRVNGVTVGVPSVSQRVLLARLALAAGRSASVATLIDVLWPGGPPPNADGNLQSYVSRLRRIVGARRLVREAAGYRLHVDDTDVDEVERQVAAARAVAGSDARVAAQRLGEALRRWRGEPLSDLPDALPFAPELARLTAWRRRIEEEWFDARLAAGQAAEALPDLEHAVTADPLRETLCTALARALHQVGRTADALRVLDDFRHRLAEDTGLDPGAVVGELRQRLLAGEASLRPPPAHPKPAAPRYAPLDLFVGRAAELDTAAQALRARRVVTLTGPGGIGKTRLALELLDRLAEPTVLARLAEVSGSSDVPAAVAAAAGLRVALEGATVALADRVGTEPTILVLDNCEHVLNATRTLAAELLARCPDLRILGTSRRRLDLPGEQVLQIGPPAVDEQVRLFCDRAALLRADFEPTDRVTELATEICATLDGLPLAVELAARREAVFGMSALRDRLRAGLDVLEPARAGDRTTAVRATVEWSYRLLDPEAQRLLDRLAVCRSGFDLDTVEQLAPAANAPALLTELVEASLVVPEHGAEPPRYRLLEPTRRIALAHLDADSLEAAREDHANWAMAVAEAIHERQLARSPEAAALLLRNAANLRDALAWSAESGAWARAGRLAVLLALQLSDLPDLAVHGQIERLPTPPDAPREVAGLCALAAGTAAWLSGDARRADRLVADALDRLPDEHSLRWIADLIRLMNAMYAGEPADVAVVAAAVLDRPGVPAFATVTTLCNVALVHGYAGDPAAGARWLDRNAALVERMAKVDGFVAYTQGELLAATDPQRALALLERAFRLADERGHLYNREVAGIGRAAVRIRLGRHAEAARACMASIGMLRALGMWAQLWMMLRLVAELLVAVDDPEPAAFLLAAADADPLAPTVFGPDRQRQAALRDAIADRLGDRLDAATRAGAVAGRVEAARRAVDALRPHAGGPVPA